MLSLSTTTSWRTQPSRIVAAVSLLSLLAVVGATLVPQVTSAGVRQSGGAERRLVVRAGFESPLRSWTEVNRRTRLDRVRGGYSGSRHAARLRTPRHSRATIGLTDRPSLVKNSRRGQVYQAHVWLKASKKTVGPGVVAARLYLGEAGTGSGRASAWRRVRLTNTHWRSVTVWLTSRADGRRLDVSVRALDVRAGGSVRVDNVTVRKVAPPKVPTEILRGTAFGASVDNAQQDWIKALRRSDRRFSHLDVVRVYDPDVPSDWTGWLGDTNRPLVFSFSARPAAVIAGRYDRELRSWFRQAPSRWPIWWSYQHEPEDDIERGEYSASHYRQAWRHINRIAHVVDNPRLRPTLILMCWTLAPSSGRTFSDYYPGDFIKVLSWDCYNSSSLATRYKPPGEIFYRAIRKTRALHKQFGVAEVGSRLLPGDDGSRRAMWLADIARYAGQRNAAFMTYWDARIPAGNFQLRDLPSRRAWRAVVRSR